jgi:hypothetical protein
MPRISEKKKDLCFFYNVREMLCDEWMDNMALAFNENDDLDIEIEFLDCILEEIEGVRYYSRSFKILKNPSYRETVFTYDEKNLRQILRMNLNSFYWILDKIEFNSVFFNHSNNPQRPVFEQLAVALEIFGSYGNAASLLKFARIWAIGEEQLYYT